MAPTGPRLSEWLGRLARYLYLADLIPDREILDLGCGIGLGCEFLANHGAKRVIGVDSERTAIAEARLSHALVNVEYQLSRYDSLELEDESVDLIFASGAELLRKRSVAAELRRVLRKDGHLVWAVASADRARASGGASFHELGDRLGELFGEHSMIAVQSLAALTLVEYAEGEPAIELDTSLSRLGAGRDEVHEYLAVFGPADEQARPYTVVQLPPPDGLQSIMRAAGLAGGGSEELQARLSHEVAARQRAETALADLRVRLAEAERASSASDTAVDVHAVDEQPTVVSIGSERIAEVLGEHAVFVDQLERALAESREFADELIDERDELEAEVRRLHGELRAEEARVATMRSQIGDWRDRFAKAEGSLLRQSLERAAATPAEPAVDVPTLSRRIGEAEALLREQQAVAAQLESLALELAGDLESEHATGNAAVDPPEGSNAELVLLTIGLRSLKSKLREVADDLAAARQQSPDDLASAVVRAIGSLRNFSRD